MPMSNLGQLISRWFPRRRERPSPGRRFTLRTFAAVDLLGRKRRRPSPEPWTYVYRGESRQPVRRHPAATSRPESRAGIDDRLGQLLLRAGVLNAEELGLALEQQARTRTGSLGRLLVEMRLASERQVGQALSEALGLNFIDLEEAAAPPELVNLVPQHIAERHQIVPVSRAAGVLELAMADPLDVLAADDVALMTGLKVKPVVATPTAVERTIEHGYRVNRSLDKLLDDLCDLEEPTSAVGHDPATGVEWSENDSPIVRLCNLIVQEGVRSRATALQLESFGRQFLVKRRVDGQVRTILSPPWRAREAVFNRFRLLAGLPPGAARREESGAFRIVVDGCPVTVRATFVPALAGQTASLALDREVPGGHSLDDLGFEPFVRTELERALRPGWGAILLTGPPDSGRRTTAQAILMAVAAQGVPVAALARPGEPAVPGVSQVPVEPRLGLDPPSAWRACLHLGARAIFAGELTSPELARLALESARAGRLVLATLPVAETLDTGEFLLESGVSPSLQAASVRLVLGQRLLRRGCTACKEEWVPPSELLVRFNLHCPDGLTRARGCVRCEESGYAGRVPAVEVVRPDDEACPALRDAVSPGQVREAYRRGRLSTLADSARGRAVAGVTTLDELEQLGWCNPCAPEDG